MSTFLLLASIVFAFGGLVVALLFWMALSSPVEEDDDAMQSDKAALDSIRGALEPEQKERRKVRAL